MLLSTKLISPPEGFKNHQGLSAQYSKQITRIHRYAQIVSASQKKDYLQKPNSHSTAQKLALIGLIFRNYTYPSYEKSICLRDLGFVSLLSEKGKRNSASF
jgi:hypothetical protein